MQYGITFLFILIPLLGTPALASTPLTTRTLLAPLERAVTARIQEIDESIPTADSIEVKRLFLERDLLKKEFDGEKKAIEWSLEDQKIKQYIEGSGGFSFQSFEKDLEMSRNPVESLRELAKQAVTLQKQFFENGNDTTNLTRRLAEVYRKVMLLSSFSSGAQLKGTPYLSNRLSNPTTALQIQTRQALTLSWLSITLTSIFIAAMVDKLSPGQPPMAVVFIASEVVLGGIPGIEGSNFIFVKKLKSILQKRFERKLAKAFEKLFWDATYGAVDKSFLQEKYCESFLDATHQQVEKMLPSPKLRVDNASANNPPLAETDADEDAADAPLRTSAADRR